MRWPTAHQVLSRTRSDSGWNPHLRPPGSHRRQHPVGEQCELQLHAGKPRPVTHPSGQPEPAQRSVAFLRGQAGKQVDGIGRSGS